MCAYSMTREAALVEVNNVSIAYGEAEPSVTDVNFSLEEGEVLVIVGESGSGKTTVIRALIGCLSVGGHVVGGQLHYRGQDLGTWSEAEWRKCRGTDISMIFQDSGSAMDPIQTIGKQFIAHIRRHSGMTKSAAETRVLELLNMVSLPGGKDLLQRYPFELSGGQRQRLGIAMAMAFTPHLLLADEPTSALDVTTQAQIVEELMRLCKQSKTGIIMVIHNIGVAAYMADKIMVMQQGKVVDYGSRDDVLFNTHSDYTAKLLEAIPTLGGTRYVDTVE